MIKAFGGGAVGFLGDEGRREWDQSHNQPMNTAGAAASSVGVYVYVHRLYTYTILCSVYVLCMKKRKQHLCQNHKTITWIT